MPTIIIRLIGLVAQVFTAFRLIKIFDLKEYGNYAVYIFEMNLLAIFLSFGVISFNINNLIENNSKAFYQNNALVIQFSFLFQIVVLTYFIVKYGFVIEAILILLTCNLKILQNICYSGILGEKGIKYYNIYLNVQLVLFLCVTFTPNISIVKLLLAWLILTLVNVILLRKYIINSFKYMKWANITYPNLKLQVNRSVYDFNNNLTNRYELIVLSFIEKYAFLVGLLSVFMQVSDSLVNFFKTLAPKIQAYAIVNPKKTKQLHLLVIVFFSAAIIVIVLTYNVWVAILKEELLKEYDKFVYWSIAMLLSIILWSLRFELQSKDFNITKYNIINIILITIISFLSVIFADNFYIIVSLRVILLTFLIIYVYKQINKYVQK